MIGNAYLTKTSYSLHSQIEQVTNLLGVKKFKANGWAKYNTKCPFHDDKFPSATLHSENGLYCHACGKMYTWKELSSQLGVAWLPARSGQPNSHRYLTDEIIQKLVAKKRVKACQVLAKLFKDGYEGQVVTVNDIVDFTGCANKTANRIADEFLSYLPTFNLKEVGKRDNNSKRGRKTRYFLVPKLPELEKMLDCDKSKRQYTIEVSGNVEELKAEVTALPIKRSPNKTAQLPMKYLAKAAGWKSPKTARKYVKMVASVEKDDKAYPLPFAELNDMPESQREYISSRKRGDGWKSLEVRGVRYAYNKPQALLAVMAAGSVEAVTVHVTKANIYKYVGLPEVPQWVSLLQKALIVSGARQEALYGNLEPQKDWTALMDEMDAKIEAQKEAERQWEQKRVESDLFARQLPMKTPVFSFGD